MRDWQGWHQPYDDPDSALSRRLRLVQAHIGSFLDRVKGPVRVVSACAGDGRDLIGVLGDHPARQLVSARLVEQDETLSHRATQAAVAAGLPSVEVVRADAGAAACYVGAVPAHLVLFCGVFGNISDADVHRTVRALPQLCLPGATVIWTRSRRDPDLTPAVRGWFAESGFDEVAFEAPEDALFSVGVHRFAGESPDPFLPTARLFRFAGENTY